MGMVSEVLRLDGDERRELAQLCCRFGRDRGAVVISAGAESAKTAETYARHTEQCGAAAVMAIPPVSIAVGEEELLTYYRRIIAATHLPVIVQDASGTSGA
jgi:dihydrodipicolinate synthase/N-acetylneuraminate lyase